VGLNIKDGYEPETRVTLDRTHVNTAKVKTQLHCPGIGRNAADWAVVSFSAQYGASAAAYTGMTRLSI